MEPEIRIARLGAAKELCWVLELTVGGRGTLMESFRWDAPMANEALFRMNPAGHIDDGYLC